MDTVKINASKKYEVKIGSGLLKDVGKYISEIFSGKTIMIVSDDTVFSLYGEELKNGLEKSNFKTVNFVFPHGEQSKNISVYCELLSKMCESHLTRGDAVIALGGGVVGDLAGFAAATYQRGITLIQIPTTLLAAVDSSVGGKTGVDLPNGKNQVGAFYQPSLVVCDTETFKTLPYEEYQNGCAEIIKYAMIGSGELFKDIIEKPICDQYESIVRKCVSMKRDYVEKDERDLGLRMMLNFGHTIGHAIETCSLYTIPHGKAVAIGMAIITKAACAMGICNNDVLYKIINVLNKYELPSETSFNANELAKTSMNDKKINGDKITLVVPKNVGECELKEICKDDFINWLNLGGVK